MKTSSASCALIRTDCAFFVWMSTMACVLLVRVLVMEDIWDWERDKGVLDVA